MPDKSGNEKTKVEDLPTKELSQEAQEQTKGGLRARGHDDDDDLSDLEIQRNSKR